MKLKVVFLGSSGVGKTSIISKFCIDSFSSDCTNTVGIDYFSKKLMIGEESVQLQIWDTAGQEKYKSIVPAYIRGSSMAFIVYDMTDKGSYSAALECFNNVKMISGDSSIVILVGNKVDLVEKEENEDEEAANFAKANGCLLYQTSAKTGYNIAAMFEKAAETALINASGRETEGKVEIVVTQEKQRACC